MKYTLLIAAGLCFAIIGCSEGSSSENRKNDVVAGYKSGEYDADKVAADTLAPGNGSSGAAVENLKDKEHTFIRTADVKFKVKNVAAATYRIEDITTQHGGFVTLTTLNSTVDNVATTPVSADSSLETTSYTISNTMTLRVPNVQLDTTLKEIARLVDYLDYRIIKADDVSLQLQASTMAQKRLSTNRQRLAGAVDSRGGKLNDVVDAEETLLDKQTQADEALLNTLSMGDQVKYSTVQLSIYQRQAIKRELIGNNNNIDAYQPGFGSRLVGSLQYGLEVLADFFVALVKLWWLFLLGLGGWFIYKKYGFKFGK